MAEILNGRSKRLSLLCRERRIRYRVRSTVASLSVGSKTCETQAEALVPLPRGRGCVTSSTSRFPRLFTWTDAKQDSPRRTRRGKTVSLKHRHCLFGASVQNVCFRSVAARLQRCWHSVGQPHLKDFPLARSLRSLKIAKNAKNSSSHSALRVLLGPHPEFRIPCCSWFCVIPFCLLLSANRAILLAIRVNSVSGTKGETVGT
jgi:hypothetical protein